VSTHGHHDAQRVPSRALKRLGMPTTVSKSTYEVTFPRFSALGSDTSC
jgi:hypothetical protein